EAEVMKEAIGVDADGERYGENRLQNGVEAKDAAAVRNDASGLADFDDQPGERARAAKHSQGDPGPCKARLPEGKTRPEDKNSAHRGEPHGERGPALLG